MQSFRIWIIFHAWKTNSCLELFWGVYVLPVTQFCYKHFMANLGLDIDKKTIWLAVHKLYIILENALSKSKSMTLIFQE